MISSSWCFQGNLLCRESKGYKACLMQVVLACAIECDCTRADGDPGEFRRGRTTQYLEHGYQSPKCSAACTVAVFV